MYILFFENERCPRKEKPLEILDSSKPFKLWIQDVKFEHISTPYLTVYMKHHPWNLPPHLPPMSHRQPQRGAHKPRGWNSWEVSSSSGVVAVCSTSEYVKTWGEKRSRGFSPFIQFFCDFLRWKVSMGCCSIGFHQNKMKFPTSFGVNKWLKNMKNWLVVEQTHLKKISQNGIIFPK